MPRVFSRSLDNMTELNVKRENEDVQCEIIKTINVDAEVTAKSKSPKKLIKLKDRKTRPSTTKLGKLLSPKLSHYPRKMILEAIQNSVDKRSPCTTIDYSISIEEFVNNRALLSQNNVHYECESPSFQSVEKWIQVFQEKNFNTTTQNEPSLIMKAIGILEDHPNPKHAGGIDFKSLYKFIGDVMCGDPTDELNGPTKEFLYNVFQDLLNVANSSQGDLDVADMHKTLQSRTENEFIKNETYVENSFQLGLDPLHICKTIENE